MARPRRFLLAPLVLGIVGVPILLFLGNWQVDRLAWKLGLIHEIEARLEADPVELPPNPDSTRDRLLRVTVAGQFEGAELHALSSIKEHGPGYRIVTPLTVKPHGTGTERKIMVDLGFVPEHLKSSEMRAYPKGVRGTVTGFLHWPSETDSYTPAPDQARNIWFARDVVAMAKALGTEPTLVVAETHPFEKWPLPRPPGSGLRNSHLEYAITWFGLAVVWALMSAIWFWSEWRKA